MKQSRGNIVIALMLIVLGGWFLAMEVVPELKSFMYTQGNWPWQVIGVGALFVIVGILAWKPGLFIPGFVIGGIGGILYYQNTTHDWGSWSYAWTLIPGFVGAALVLVGLLKRSRGTIISGLWNLFSSLVLFGIFGYAFARLQFAAVLWPVGLILLGAGILVSGIFKRR